MNYQSNDNAAENNEQLAQQIKQIEGLAKKYLTKDALLRFGSLKLAHQEKAVQVALAIAQMVQSGFNEKIDDAMLKEMLQQLQEEKKETKIKWR